MTNRIPQKYRELASEYLSRVHKETGQSPKEIHSHTRDILLGKPEGKDTLSEWESEGYDPEHYKKYHSAYKEMSVHNKAENLRMNNKGSQDPLYKEQHKNK